MKRETAEVIDEVVVSAPPNGIRVIFREFKKDKIALVSLGIIVVLMLFAFVGSMLIDQREIMRVSLLDKYAPPGEGFILGADSGGRSIMGQLIMGARNSIIIGFAVTIITAIIGISYGLVSGYFGGTVDNILMRIVDFILLLPTQMIIIVFITIVSKVTIWTFIYIMSAFYWVGKARLIRSKTLSEVRKDYVGASKTLGSSHFKIIFREILPNLSSLIIVNLTMNFAGNIGIEAGLTYLGFGLPVSISSLGTLINYATSPDVLSQKIWVWLPASIFILVMMLSINYVGQALKRAADARQRLG